MPQAYEYLSERWSISVLVLPITWFPTQNWSLFKLAKSRWEIENERFNGAKNLYWMKHIQHHHPNSMLVNWIFVLLALMIERLYRTRYLHRGSHPTLVML